jgi:hypothetical protein
MAGLGRGRGGGDRVESFAKTENEGEEMSVLRFLKEVGAITLPNYYLTLLEIDGKEFVTPKGTWVASVTNEPQPQQDSTLLLYKIEFAGPSLRRLDLSVPEETLAVEKRQSEIMIAIRDWLMTDETQGARFVR